VSDAKKAASSTILEFFEKRPSRSQNAAFPSIFARFEVVVGDGFEPSKA